MRNQLSALRSSFSGIKFNGLVTGVAAFSLLIAGCKSGSSGDFTQDKATGVLYKFIKHNESGAKPAAGDWAQVEMDFKTDRDSVIMNTKTRPKSPRDTSHGIPIQLKFNFQGCLEQAITLMAVGDSAIFKINADSLFIKQFRQKQLPPYIKPGSMLTFEVKLLSFLTQAQVQKMQQDMQAKRQAEMEKAKAGEQPAIDKYLADHHYNVKPNKDSLYILSKSSGKGPAIKDGDTISVGYMGRTLAGVGFDSSTAAHGPYKFAYSANAPAIKGWILVLKGMHQGDKVKVLIPSALAYDGQGMSAQITPYSPLVFDMEVLKVGK